MHSNRIRSLFCALTAGSLLVALPAAANVASDSASELCGGDKNKDVKKPKPEDDKKPNPASASGLCGGDKNKDVKKPKPEDDKKPQNPASTG